MAFIAVPGAVVDGHDFLEAALVAGAALAVVQKDREAAWSKYDGRVPLLVVEDTRKAMGAVAAEVYGRPSHGMRLVGVTGTDGKSTTCHLTTHVLTQCGIACGYLSSVGFDTGQGFEPNELHMTTLEATQVQERLARAVEDQRAAMCVEASSEGLAQHRLEGCEFDVAVFRNLTRDHLDFHGTMEAYRDAKGILFDMLERVLLQEDGKPFPKAAVVNADDPASAYMLGRTRARPVTYGIESPADVRGHPSGNEELRIALDIEAGGRRVRVRAPLMIAYNCLAAVAVALSQGVALEDAAPALDSFPGVPGRFEVIDCGQPFTVIVDIASTPAALESVLGTLRPATHGRLWAVFGAAGERDPARRDGMGRAVAALADRAVLTNEDPRDEDPDAIIEAIAKAMRDGGKKEGRDFVKIPDRREAIRYAFENAASGDTVLLAGKATEPFMVFGDEHVPWDERRTARDLLSGAKS